MVNETDDEIYQALIHGEKTVTNMTDSKSSEMFPNRYDTSQKTNAERRTLNNAIDTLFDEISRYEDLLNDLTQRLQGIIIPGDTVQKTTEDPHKAPPSPVHAMILTAIHRVSECNTALTILTNSVDL
jgi:hypothetical protein